MATTIEALSEEDELEVLTMTTEASIEEAEDTTRLSEPLKPQGRRCVYRQRVSTTATAELAE